MRFLVKRGICLEDMLNNLSAIKCGHMYHTQW